MAIQTTVFEPLLVVAIDAVVHLHPRNSARALALKRRAAPNVARVTADAVLLIGPEFVRGALIAVALFALELAELDVGDVREKDVFRLARVGGPVGLAIRRDVAIDEVLLRDGRAHGRGVTAGALIERGDAREGSVVAKRVAIVAFEPRLVGVDLVAVIDRLRPAPVDV